MVLTAGAVERDPVAHRRVPASALAAEIADLRYLRMRCNNGGNGGHLEFSLILIHHPIFTVFLSMNNLLNHLFSQITYFCAVLVIITGYPARQQPSCFFFLPGSTAFLTSNNCSLLFQVTVNGLHHCAGDSNHCAPQTSSESSCDDTLSTCSNCDIPPLLVHV